MARFYDKANTPLEMFSEPDINTVVYCKLFGDVVAGRICVMRREILTSRNGFPCKGCIINIALDSRAS